MNAEKVLEQYWDEGSLPIDPYVIAARAGVVVQQNPFINMSGNYRAQGDSGQPQVTVNTNNAPVHQRFTLAHELGHYFLSHSDCNRDLSEEPGAPDEIAANNFAADLLMPKRYIDVCVNVHGYSTVESLASLFNVSTQAMGIRLRRLGYLA